MCRWSCLRQNYYGRLSSFLGHIRTWTSCRFSHRYSMRTVSSISFRYRRFIVWIEKFRDVGYRMCTSRLGAVFGPSHIDTKDDREKTHGRDITFSSRIIIRVTRDIMSLIRWKTFLFRLCDIVMKNEHRYTIILLMSSNTIRVHKWHTITIEHV